MSLLYNEAIIGAAGQSTTYEIEQSLRFNSADNAYLSRTFGTGGSSVNFTISLWAKKASNDDSGFMLLSTSGTAGSGRDQFYINSAEKFQFYGSSQNNEDSNNVLLRDLSAWYHIVVACDMDNSTASDRIKVFYNGQRQASVSTSITSFSFFGGNRLHYIGTENDGVYNNGYIAEYHYIDGTTKEETDFGEYDDNGVWRPVEYTGSYGTNGFYLKFDPSATNGIGHDHSGNGNNFTATGFTVNPDSYVLATKTSGTFSTGTLRDVFDTNSGNSGGVYQEATTGSEAASTIDIEFSSALSGTITVTASDGTGGTNNGGQYQLIDSTDTVQVTQARPTNTTTFTHTGLSDITKLRMYGGSSGLGGILISRFESSDQTIRTADWLGDGDVLSDTPTTNWCTLNPLKKGANVTLSDGNLVATMTSTNVRWNGTIAMSPGSGKYYTEMTVTQTNNYGSVGLSSIDDPSTGELGSNAYKGFDGSVNGASYGSSYGTGDVIGVAYDAVNGALYFSKNGTWQNSGDPTSGSSATGAAVTGLTGTYVFGGGIYGGATGIYTLNFGQRAFAYTPPTGYKALNTANLPAPAIADGSQYFDTTLYTGNSAARTISTNSAFTPDFIWIKGRSGAYNHSLQDVVRGFASGKAMGSNLTGGESAISTQAGYVSGVGAGTFDLDADATATWYHVNVSGQTYAAWNWKANGSGSSNTTGTITSTVSANSSAGFSIVSYTGTGANATVGHGLGVAPKMVIVKSRDTNPSNWLVYHSEANTGNPGYMYLDLALQNQIDNGNGVWNNTRPTSTVFSVGNYVYTNKLNDKFIAYCFAEVEGFSKFGTYQGSTNLPFVYCGFRPAFIILKPYDLGSGWYLYDTARGEYNVVSMRVLAESAAAETSAAGNDIDILSNGFRLRGVSNSGSNYNGKNYIFCAWAEHPFGGSGVSPATAR